MRSTALQAAALAVLASPAAAQLAVNARPTGGQVSAGQASISDTASKTLINQSSQNAAINWQSYNVGSGQTVQYVQPNAASMTLNRVVGADPSLIAGHILANGQIVLVNQSGVVFAKGAQVDTAGLVVTTAGITDKNFMAGHLVFDQAGRPGAAVSNAGNITVRQAGLAALVAPQVANSGTITARLGRVILGGAETHTLDLYGDGLVALNVSGQVTQASLGGKQVTALVTNTGTILAPGGTVVLSAAAVDGVVTNLVEAGGKVAAPSVGAQTGRVLVQGIGGGISIDGEVSATGVAAGTKGGQVVANATGAVKLGAGALVDASGDAGGGIVAIGTTAARAIGGASVTPTLVAQSVSLAAGSRVSANATHRGAGGRIAVLSRNATTQSGDVAARGGPVGGAGGWIEISGANVDFGGLLDMGAAHGAAGTLLIDPENLDIGAATTIASANGTSYISAAQFTAFSNNVILKADGVLTVTNAITTGAATSLELEGDEGIVIKAPIVARNFGLGLTPGIPVALNSPGLPAGYGNNPSFTAVAGSIAETLTGAITGSSISAQSNGPITLGGANVLSTVATFSNVGQRNATGFATSNTGSTSSTLVEGNVTSGDLTLTGITATTTGGVTLGDAASLAVQAPVLASGGDVAISVSGTNTGPLGVTPAAPNSLTVTSGITGNNVTLDVTGSVAGYAGTAFTEGAETTIAAVGSGTATGGTLSIGVTSGDISIAGELLTTSPPANPQLGGPIAGTVTIVASAGDITEDPSTGSIVTDTLSGAASGTGTQGTPPAGNADFLVAGNTITTLTGTTTLTIPGVTTPPGFATTGTFALEDSVGLTVKNLASGSTVLIQGSLPNSDGNGGVTGIVQIAGTITANGNITINDWPGIAELGTAELPAGTSAASIYSVNGSVGLSTTGAIAQGAGAAITGGESSFAPGVSLAASGSTTFSNFAGATAFGTISGISLGGTVTAGTPASPPATSAYSGWVTLVTTGGVGIQELAGGSIRAGTLSGNVAGSFVSSTSSSNSISTIGTSATDSFSAAGSLLLENDVGLTVVGTLSAGTTLGVFGPTTATGLLTVDGPVTANSITLSHASGISLNGTVTAGTFDVNDSAFTGNLELDATAGGITEGSNGSLRAGTLSGTATAAVPANGSAALAGGAGNTIATLTGFTVSGNLTLDDGAALNLGTVTAGTTLTTPTNGTLYSGSVTLTSTGDIDGSAGALRAGTVVAQAAGALKLDPTSGNIIGTISGHASGGDVLLEDDSGLTIGSATTTLSASGSVSVTEPGEGIPQDGVLIIAGAVSANGSITLDNALGIGLQGTGSLTSTNSIISLTTPGAISQQNGSTITAESSPGTAAGAGTGTLLTLTAGPAQTVFPALTGLGTVTGMALGGTLTAGTLASNGQYTGSIAFTATAVDINEFGTGSINADTLVGDPAAAASATFLSNDGNVIGTLSNFRVTGSFALEDNSGLLLLGPAAVNGSIDSIDIHGPVPTPSNLNPQPTGILVIDGNVAAAGNINLSNALGVVLLSGTGTVGNSVSSTSGGVTLASAGGAVFEQVGATITSGVTTSGTAAILLSAGGSSTDFGTAITAVDPSLTPGTIGPITGVEFDGVVAAGTAGAYGSAVFLAKSGDIVQGQTTGSLAVGSLTFVATAGNVTLDPSSGNTIGSIGGSGTILTTSKASGNVRVEDDTGLTLAALTAGGSIYVHDPAAGPTGILQIDGVVSAGSSITLANALGIAELTGGSVTSTNSVVSLTSSGGAILQQTGASLAGGTGSGSLTLLAISAGGTTDFSTYNPALTATVHGISFAGTLSAGQPTFTAATGTLYNGTIALTAGLTSDIGDITEDGAQGSTASLRAATLASNVSSTGTDAVNALFSTPHGNSVGTLSGFSVSGNFELEDDVGLHVLGQTAGGTLYIHGPSSSFTPTGLLVIDGTLTAPGAITLDNALGIAELANAAITSTGTAAAVTLTSAGGAIAQQTLSTISVTDGQSITLSAGGTTNFASLLPGASLTAVSGLSFLGTLDAGPTGSVDLIATSGDINEGANAALRAGSLSGSTGTTGTVALAPASGNSIGAVGSFGSGGNFALEDDIGLTINALRAGGALDVHGPTDGTAQTGTLTLAGTLSGSSVSLSNDNGISLGGTLTAGNLANSVYTGTTTLTSRAGAIVQTGGSVQADTLSGRAGGDADFGLDSNAVSTLTAFSADNLTLHDTIGPEISGLTAGGTITVLTPPPGNGLLSNILRITGTSTAMTGIALSNGTGILEEAGASLSSPFGTVTLSSGGAISQLAGGTLSGGTGLTLTADGGTSFSSLAQTPDVQGIAFAGTLVAGTLSPSGTLYSGSANFTALSGDIVEQQGGVQQQGGVLLAGSLSARAEAGPSAAGSILLGNTSSATLGNQLGALNTVTSSAGLSLVDGQTLSVTGIVTVGTQDPTATNLQIIAPAIDVTTGALQLQAPAGVVDLVADHFVFGTPGTPGAVSTPGGVVALDLLNANGAGSIFSVGPGNDTVSAASLANIQSQHGTLAIGSLDGVNPSPADTVGTSWSLGQGGTVTAITFAAPVDLGGAASPAALGLFSDDVIAVSNGVTVASLYGSAGSSTAGTGTARFLGSNAIGTLGVLHDDGNGTLSLIGFSTTRTANSAIASTSPQFQLDNAAPLLVLGPVSAKQGAVDISVSGTTAGLANALTIGGTLSAAATLTAGQISGTDIALLASGKITQITGTLNAFGAATATNGTIAIHSTGGPVSLESRVTGGTFTSTGFTQNANSALLIEADGGDINEINPATLSAGTLSAGTLAALASGNILLGGASNSFANVGSLSSVSAASTLYGLTASGVTGINLRDTSSLLIADNTVSAGVTHATVSAIGTSLAGGGTGSIAISITAPGSTLTLGTATGATVDAIGNITLTAPGDITQTKGTITSLGTSLGDGVTLTSLAGSITQTGAHILADGGDALILAPTGFLQSGSLIEAANDVRVRSTGGSLVQTSSTILGTHGVVLDILDAISSTGFGTIASTSGTVVVDSQSSGITFDGTMAGVSVLLSAGNGSIAEAAQTGVLNAGTLAAQALGTSAGNIDLASANNHIANIGSLSSVQPTLALTLTGLYAQGANGITLVDQSSLNILPDTSAQPVVQATSTGASITINDAQALTLGQSGISTVEANRAVSLQAVGSVTQESGLVQSDTSNVGIASTHANVIQSGATFYAAQDLTVSAFGSIIQTAGLMEGIHRVSLAAGSDVRSVQSTITSPGIQHDATSGTVSIGAAGNMTLASLISAQAPSGAVRLAAQGFITQTSSSPSFTGTILTPTLAASAGGDLSLTGANKVGTITNLGTIAGLPTLTGLSAGTGNIHLNDTVSLVLAPAASLTALAGSILLDVADASHATTPTLLSNTATILADRDVTLLSDGALTQTGGLIESENGGVTVTAGAFTQNGGARLLAPDLAPGVIVSQRPGTITVTASGTIQQSVDSLISAAQTLALLSNVGTAFGDVTIAGTLQAGTLGAAGTYSGSMFLEGANIFGSTGTLLTGQLQAFAVIDSALTPGVIDLSGPANNITSLADPFGQPALSGSTITVVDTQSLSVLNDVIGAGPVTFTIPTASFTVAPSVLVTSTLRPLTVTAGGSILISTQATLSGAATSLSAGTALTEQEQATITASTAQLSAGTSLTLDGTLSTTGSANLTAGTDISQGTIGLIQTAGSPLTLTAGGTVTLDGVLADIGPLSIASGSFDQGGGSITAGTTSITATGAITVDSALTATGSLTLTAGTDITQGSGSLIKAAGATFVAGGDTTLNGTLQDPLALLITADNITLGTTGTISSGPATLIAASAITLDGPLTSTGDLTATAGTDIVTNAAISSSGTAGFMAGGRIGISASLTSSGSLTLDAGNDVTLASTGAVNAGPTSIAATLGAVTLDGTLTTGDLTAVAGTDILAGAAVTSSTIGFTAGDSIEIASGLTSIGSLTLAAVNDVTLASTGTITAGPASITATLGAITLDGPVTTGDLAAVAGTDILAGAAVTSSTISFAAGDSIEISSPLTSTGSLALAAINNVTLDSTGTITAGLTSITATQGAITIGGPVVAVGDLNASAGSTIAITGSFSVAGSLALAAGTDLSLGTLSVIHAGASTLIADSGAAILDGALIANGPLTITAGTDVSQGQTGFIAAGGIAISAGSGTVDVAGQIESTSGLAISAGTDIDEAAGATIAGDATQAGLTHAALLIPSSGATLTAGGNITLDGTLTDPFAITLAADDALTLNATGAITGGPTSLTATLGAITLDGPFTATGDVTASAGTDILVDATFNSGGMTGFAAGGTIAITGRFSSAGSLTLGAGSDVALDAASTLTAGATSITGTSGAVTLDGTLAVAGGLTVDAGTNISQAATGIVTGAPITLTAGGPTSITGSLIGTGPLAITTGTSFLESASGSVTGGPITLTATNGAVTIDGVFSSGAAATILAATDFTEGAGASLIGVPLSVTARTGALTIDGLFTSTGAFTIDAGTDITQGNASTISNTNTLVPQTLTSQFLAPGTITLGGTLSALSLQIGDPVTKSTDPETQAIIWNNTVVLTGSNAAIHGATKSISIPAPLMPGNGAGGVYLDTASFQQTGTATVAPIQGTGNAATMQLTIEGRGNAQFGSLVAPSTQLLLVLEHGGTASGNIDVAGLNIYYTTGVIPLKPVSLHGTVDGRGGFAAATVGFSHHLPNQNYQFNACPVQSINCILLSPLVVPIVDPVNDYAEGTQRKRRQDDEALPNVGEEDY